MAGRLRPLAELGSQQRPGLFTRLARFASIGVLATATHAFVYGALVTLSDVAPLVANLVAYCTAVLMSFSGHRRWTFADRHVNQSTSATRRQFTRFVAVSLTGLGLNSLLVFLLVDVIHMHPLTALVPMISVVPALTYALLARWTFPEQQGARER